MLLNFIIRIFLTTLVCLSILLTIGCVDNKSENNENNKPESTLSKSAKITLEAKSESGHVVTAIIPSGAFSLAQISPDDISIEIDNNPGSFLDFEIKPSNLILDQEVEIKIDANTTQKDNDIYGIASLNIEDNPLFIKQYRLDTGEFIGNTYSFGKFSLLKFDTNQVDILDDSNFKKVIRSSWKKTLLYVNSCIWTSQMDIDDENYSRLIALASEAAQGCASYYLSNLTDLDLNESIRLLHILKITGEKEDSLIMQQLTNQKDNIISNS